MTKDRPAAPSLGADQKETVLKAVRHRLGKKLKTATKEDVEKAITAVIAEELITQFGGIEAISKLVLPRRGKR